MKRKWNWEKGDGRTLTNFSNRILKSLRWFFKNCFVKFIYNLLDMVMMCLTENASDDGIYVLYFWREQILFHGYLTSQQISYPSYIEISLLIYNLYFMFLQMLFWCHREFHYTRLSLFFQLFVTKSPYFPENKLQQGYNLNLKLISPSRQSSSVHLHIYSIKLSVTNYFASFILHMLNRNHLRFC